MRHHSIAVAIPLFLAIGFAACDMPPEETAMPGEERPNVEVETPLPPALATMTAQFTSPDGADSEVGGDITLTATDLDEFRVDASLRGLAEGPHAWHIHSAACGTDAPVVVPFTETADMEALGQPLTPDENGNATASVAVPGDVFSFEQLEVGEYSVHVHERGGLDHGPTVACANL
ncbi:MAG TPA: CHRD domain-containing protein [Longimicrobiales bacterium]|nr:CHRD domain-containing protein [Longimicrobiales bacterium]